MDFAVARLGEGAMEVATEAAEDEAARVHTVAPAGQAGVEGEKPGSVPIHNIFYGFLLLYTNKGLLMRACIVCVGLLCGVVEVIPTSACLFFPINVYAYIYMHNCILMCT